MFNLLIFGRTNVGKTSLFNLLTNTNIATVSNKCCSTSDFNYGILSYKNKNCICTDIIGLLDFNFLNKKNKLYGKKKKIFRKIIYAIKNADLIFLVFDISVGLTFQDMFLYNYFLKFKKNNFLVIINKIDLFNSIDRVYFLSKFYCLNIKIIYPISVFSKENIIFLLNDIFYKKKEFYIKKVTNFFYIKSLFNLCINLNDYLIKENVLIKKKLYISSLFNLTKKNVYIILIGKSNVGKSTLSNYFFGNNRSIISNKDNTTKDFLFTSISINGINYSVVDTPGLKIYKGKKRVIFKREILKKYFKYDIFIYIIDIGVGLSKYDLYLINLFLNKGKLLFLVFNKCDKIINFNEFFYKKQLFLRYDFIKNIKIYFISAIDMKNKFFILREIFSFYKKIYSLKLGTLKLTKILKKAINVYFEKNNFCLNLVKLKYAHLGGYYPLTIVIHGNKINLIKLSYKKYLTNFYIKSLNLIGLKINLIFKEIYNPFV